MHIDVHCIKWSFRIYFFMEQFVIGIWKQELPWDFKYTSFSSTCIFAKYNSLANHLDTQSSRYTATPAVKICRNTMHFLSAGYIVNSELWFRLGRFSVQIKCTNCGRLSIWAASHNWSYQASVWRCSQEWCTHCCYSIRCILHQALLQWFSVRLASFQRISCQFHSLRPPRPSYILKSPWAIFNFLPLMCMSTLKRQVLRI